MSLNKIFTFESLPENTEQLKALPEASLKSPFMTAALVIAAACSYEKSPENSIAMLDFLKGPQSLSGYEKQFIRDRLRGKGYVARSFFQGTSPENGYEPSRPFTISVEDNAHSYEEEGYAMLYVKSSGADSPRPIKLRLKADSEEWYLWELACLSDIRAPRAADF